MVEPDRLILFIKAPVPGRVKTRLCPPLSTAEATAVHCHLAETVVRALARVDGCVTELWGDAPHPWLTALSDTHGVSLRVQSGADLGARMQHALDDGLARTRRVIIVGGDCVSVDPDYVCGARRALQTSDVVLGPAEDGGYVLIGARRIHPDMFAGVPWGGADTLNLTRVALARCGLRDTLLDTRFDIDTVDDLRRHAPQAWSGSHSGSR